MSNTSNELELNAPKQLTLPDKLGKVGGFLNSTPMLWISGLAVLVSFFGEYILPIMGQEHNEVMLQFAWISVLISGVPIASYAFIYTFYDKVISSCLLITIAMIAAIYIGDVFAAAEIAFIMAIGEMLEERTVEKAKKGIEMLLNLLPSQGRKLVTEGEKTTEIMVEAKEIQVGDLLRVLPGESFPSDGIVVTGSTTVDQSIMTGESLPVDKVEGDSVFTGTLNCYGSVDMKVTKAFAQSSLQKMISMVEDAENNKAPTQKIVDKWAGYFVPLACIIAIFTYLVMSLVFHQPDEALIRAVTVLVVFCPCALALATPTSIMAAIGQATKNGVLIKSGEALERMGNVSAVAFDKTGTITTGKLAVSEVISYEISENDLISLASSVESRSEHPLAQAVVAYARQKEINLQDLTDFKMMVGKGVSASIQGKKILCGNEKLINEGGISHISQEIQEELLTFRKQGKAVILVADETKILGIVALSDTIKENAKNAIASLENAGIHKTLLLTGDNEESAQFMAEKVGITQIHASLLPENKVAVIEDFLKQGESVCMIGDGVNDAPSLKTATVGIAMGTMGSDIAIDAADIAIMGDDISKISYIKKLSNATIYSIKFNISMAMAINFGAIILSVTGNLSPAAGALVHNAGSVLVVLNATRLYDKKIM